MTAPRGDSVKTFAQRLRDGVQFVALASLLAACQADGPQFSLGVGDNASVVVTPVGAVARALVTGHLTGDGLLRVQLTAHRWNQKSSQCRFSPYSGTGCSVTMKPVQGKFVTFTAGEGTLSPAHATTDLSGIATVELTAAAGRPITVTAETEGLHSELEVTLQFPLSQLRFGPVSDTRTGDFVPRDSLYVRYLDLNGESPEFAAEPPAVHFELVGCDAGVVVYGNDASSGPTQWQRSIAFSFVTPGVGCRWTASAPGFATVTSEPFNVL